LCARLHFARYRRLRQGKSLADKLAGVADSTPPGWLCRTIWERRDY
jgi:hypothetical protein